jgi:hypothetical protein
MITGRDAFGVAVAFEQMVMLWAIYELLKVGGDWM